MKLLLQTLPRPVFFFIFLWSEKGVGEVEGRGEEWPSIQGGGGPSIQEGGGGAFCPGGNVGERLLNKELPSRPLSVILFTRIMVWRWHSVGGMLWGSSFLGQGSTEEGLGLSVVGHHLSVLGLLGRMLVRQVGESGAWVNMKI